MNLTLTQPQSIARFAAILPRGIDAGRFARMCALAVHQSPALSKCQPASLLQAFLACAALGLEPNTPAGHAYVLPYGDKATLVVGYRGFVALIHRYDPEAVVHAAVVHDGDDFQFEFGSSAHLRHCPALTPGRQPLAAYAYVKRGNSFDFTVLPWSEILKIRDNSQGYKLALRKGTPNPWIDHLEAMAAKTAIRHLAKTANVGAQVATAAAIDARQEATPGEFDAVVIDEPQASTVTDSSPAEATPSN